MSGPSLIALEGIDGAGTTTQARLLHDWLVARRVPVLLTCEPSAGPIGQHIRRVLGGTHDASTATLALLFAADRLDHLAREVNPALRAGQTVITDRYVYSSLAYQSLELDPNWVAKINERAPESTLTIYLRVEPEIALARIQARAGPRELFDRRELQQAIAARYDDLLGRDPRDGPWQPGEDAKVWRYHAPAARKNAAGRCPAVAVIDGSAPTDRIHQQLRGLCQALFLQREAASRDG